MSLPSLVVAWLAILLTLILLDAWEGYGHRRGVRVGTLAFLCGVALFYLAIQFAGIGLAPNADTVLESARGWFEVESRAPLLAGLPGLVVAIALFYLAGLFDYLLHRYMSHHRWFWITHEYHHLPNRMSILVPGIAASPFAFFPRLLTLSVTAVGTYAACALVGLPLFDLRPALPVLFAVSAVGMASHSAFLRRYAGVHQAMRRLGLTTPHEHLLHHGIDARVNYGNFTTIWDRVFGTYVDPVRSGPPERLGLAYDQDFLGTLTFGRLKLPASWRERFQLHRFCNVGGD